MNGETSAAAESDVDLSGYLDKAPDQQPDQKTNQKPDQKKPKGLVKVDLLSSAPGKLGAVAKQYLTADYLLDEDEAKEWAEIQKALQEQHSFLSVESGPKMAALWFVGKVLASRAPMALAGVNILKAADQQPDQEPAPEPDQQTSEIAGDGGPVQLQQHDDEPPAYE